MKKIISLLITLMLVLTTMCFAATADSKLIAYIDETENGVNVNIVLKGEISQLAAISLCLKYDTENLSVNANSVTTGEALADWGSLISPLPTDENPNNGLVYMISVFDNQKNNLISVGSESEEKLLSFELIKNENGVINENSVQFADGKNVDFATALHTISNSTITDSFNASVSPSKFLTVFSPLSSENISTLKIGGYDENLDLIIGNTLNLYAENIASDIPVKWTASGSAEVDENGVVTAKSAGEATITATLENGVFAECVITVAEKEVLPTAIEITNPPSLLFINDEYIPSIKFTPEDTTDRRLEFSLSEHTNLILDSKTGLIKPTGNATAALTVNSLASENVSASVDVVSANATADSVLVASASAIVPEKIYINTDDDAVYKTAFSAYNFAGKYIPEIKGFTFTDMYDVEYVLSGNARGVTIEDGNICVSKDAVPAENLTLTVNIKNKQDNKVAASAVSNPFSIIAPASDDTLTINGTEIAQGVYSAETPVSFEYAPGTYCTVVVNGQAAKLTGTSYTVVPADEGDTDVTVYLHSNPTPGTLGYSMNTVIKKINFKIVK